MLDDTVRHSSIPGLAVVVALMVACAGGALAATDPFGWWSSDRDQARYGSNPAVRVATPAAQQIRCRSASGGRFACVPERYVCGGAHPSCRLSGTGQAYFKMDAIHSPLGRSFSRASVLAFIGRALANHAMTPTIAAKLRADLVRVPDSFFQEFRLASRYGTYGSSSTHEGRESIPPAGVPDILVCQNSPNGLSCRDLNGDLNAPVGAGVYAAIPGKGWRTVPAPKFSGGGLPPGIHFSKAEIQLLIDFLRAGTSTVSARGRVAKTTAVTPPPRPTSQKTRKP